MHGSESEVGTERFLPTVTGAILPPTAVLAGSPQAKSNGDFQSFQNPLPEAVGSEMTQP